MTVGQLAKAAQVGVETIRYYQGRGLLPVPRPTGAVRYYAHSLVDRIAFIKRAQGLGFSLQEVSTLLDLADGRNRRAVQAVTTARLAEIHTKLADLTRMCATLDELLARCQATGETHPCPIIEALVGTRQTQAGRK
jgi:MerR family mercuric resistance operon transcriptional regulator